MKSYGLFPRESGFSTDYADNFDPRINNEFAAAAFRSDGVFIIDSCRSLKPQAAYLYSMKNQRKAGNASSRGLWVP